MCGIIGVVGAVDALPVLLDGLRRLEYRGYDSAGVALLHGDSLWRARSADGVESVADLIAKCDDGPHDCATGIGHTRWATHGAPGEHNAHPHVDCASGIALIHNGIIENHHELGDELRGRGHVFTSATDTEVLVHRIEEFRREGLTLTEAVRQTLNDVTGAFAIAVVDAAEPGVIVAARRVSPLVVGISEGATYLGPAGKRPGADGPVGRVELRHAALLPQRHAAGAEYGGPDFRGGHAKGEIASGARGSRLRATASARLRPRPHVRKKGAAAARSLFRSAGERPLTGEQ